MTAKIIDLFLSKKVMYIFLPLFMFLYITNILPIRFLHK